MDQKSSTPKPCVSSQGNTPEFTVSSITVGILLAVVFGAANAYLGLRVGMTVSASIPAAVIAMGVFRARKRGSVLESNMVQTVGSAGESVAAGAIFTLPTLFLWAAEGMMERPSFWELALIALLGGFLGVFFMVPLRNALVVREHETLPYPEGTACAQVLLAGEQRGAGASTVFAGMGLAAVLKLLVDGLRAFPGEVSVKFKGFAGEIGTQIYPAVLSVGYICGPKISSYMFSGGVLSWLVLIPMIVLFGADAVMYPSATQTVAQLYEAGGSEAIWSHYIRYVGAGALATAGLISLIQSLPMIVRTVRDTVRAVGQRQGNDLEHVGGDLSIGFVFSAIVILTLGVWLIPAVPVNLLGAVIVVVFGFFFAAVSSRMVGLVGSSSNPVSGMAIATLLIATLILKFSGSAGGEGMRAAIAIGSIICIVCAVAGDTSQDLKTGYLLGATPKKQQIGELIGVGVSALAIGGTLYLLDRAWGFGSDQLAAPQATLMKMIVEGVMNAELPWNLVLIGAVIASVAVLLRIPVLPFAIGLYLPVHLSACMMVGGVVRLLLDRKKTGEERKREMVSGGILFCSGMIAGEGLMGIGLALIAVLGFDWALQDVFPSDSGSFLSSMGALAILGLTVFALLKASLWRKPNRDEK